jgi:uncharacterized protein (DUF2147 family)
MLAFFAAAALSGLWVLDGGEDVIRFEPCGEAICATIVGHQPKKPWPGPGPDPFCQAQLLRSLTWNPKSNRWEGRVLDPTTGKDYPAALIPKGPGQLTLRAWLGFEFLGRSYRYTPFPGKLGPACRILSPKG